MHAERPILIAYDGSADARAAITVAGHLLPGTPTVVLNAREPLEAVAAHLEGHPALDLLSSTSTAVLHRSGRPTLVVPPAGADAQPGNRPATSAP